jgi:hypothetical protein
MHPDGAIDRRFDLASSPDWDQTEWPVVSPSQACRRPMSNGQTTPYLEMVLTSILSVGIEIMSDTGHFPQIDEAAQTNALIDRGRLAARSMTEAMTAASLFVVNIS